MIEKLLCWFSNGIIPFTSYTEVFETIFGDVTIAKSTSKILSVNLNIFDSLEYDCWELIKKYTEQFGIELGNEDGIDFYASKAVQDVVIGLFVEAGFVLGN